MIVLNLQYILIIYFGELSKHLQYLMQRLLNERLTIQARVKNRSLKISEGNYPFFTFVLGVIFPSINPQDHFQDIFDIIESFFAMQQENDIHCQQFWEIINFCYENPSKILKLSNLENKLKKKELLNVTLELEKIIGSEKKQINHMLDSKKTIQLENHQEERKSQTEQFTEQYYMLQQKQLKQSQQLAKKLQEEEQQALKAAQQPDNVQCQICYVGLYEQQFMPLETCQHMFHINCLRQSFKMQILQNRFPLLCPNDSCKAQLQDADIKQILNAEMYTKYQDHTLKSYAQCNAQSISWCPTADCGYLFFFEKDDDVRFECPQCKKQYCLNCRVQWHKDMTCKEFKVNNTISQADEKFLSFVKGKKFKQCPKCKYWVEKNQGCDHMTCKCKFEFCYKCGGVYMKCQCMEKQKQLMEQRRQQAQARRQKKLQKLQKSKPKRQTRAQIKKKQEKPPARGRSKRK